MDEELIKYQCNECGHIAYRWGWGNECRICGSIDINEIYIDIEE